MFNLAGRGQKPGKPPSATNPASVERLFPLRLVSLAKVMAVGCYRIWTLTDILPPTLGEAHHGHCARYLPVIRALESQEEDRSFSVFF